METVRGRDFEHSQMHRRILVPGEADVPNLPRLFRIHQGFERPAGGEEAVGILHPDILVETESGRRDPSAIVAAIH